MKIDINKKYAYQGSKEKVEQLIRKPDRCETEYPWLTINSHGAALHHREDGTCPDSVYSLIESKPEPREIWAWITKDGEAVFHTKQRAPKESSYSDNVTLSRFREILTGEGEPKGLCESLGLPADSFAKSIKEQEEKELAEQREYRERIKKEVTEPETPESEEETEWRELGPDEVIQKGDEISSPGMDWGAPVVSLGQTLNRYNGRFGTLRARRRVYSETPKETLLIDALKEAREGLNVAIGIISKELPGWDWQKSSPRLALEIVKKALAEKGGIQ